MDARRTSTEHDETQGRRGLYWLKPPESETLRPIWWWNYARVICPRGGRPRPPYIGRRPWATSRFPSILVGYNHGRFIRTALNYLDCLDLHSKLSSCLWAHMSGRVGSSDQGFLYRYLEPNRQAPAPVYRSGSTGNRRKPEEFKFQFKILVQSV
jgi:hypothetical protein